MGRIYLARYLKLERQVALKLIPLQDEELKKRFLREAQLMAKLNHSNIVPVFDVGEEGGYLFYTMAYIEGQDLASLVAAKGKLREAEIKSELEVRPIFVRKAASTRGHVLVTMLAYIISLYLRQAWKHLNCTVSEGLEHLKSLCCMEVWRKGDKPLLCTVPQPQPKVQQLLEALHIRLPEVFLPRNFVVETKKKLQKNRK